MHPITTKAQLSALTNNTYVYAVIVIVAAILIAYLIATLIPYKGGKDKSYVARRIAYIITGVVGAIAFFLYNNLYVMDFIKNKGLQSQFSQTNVVCTVIIVVAYVILGVVLALCFRRSKFATVFLKPKKK